MAVNTTARGASYAEHTLANVIRHKNHRKTEQSARRLGAAAEAERRAPGDIQGHGIRVSD